MINPTAFRQCITMKLLLPLICFAFITELKGQSIGNYDFRNYKVRARGAYKKAPIRLSADYTDWQNIRYSIKVQYLEKKVNFGGFYIMAHYTHGMGTDFGVIIDTRDGKVYKVPMGGEDNFCDESNHFYHSYSRMFVTTMCPGYGANKRKLYHVYVWDEAKKQFTLIKKLTPTDIN